MKRTAKSDLVRELAEMDFAAVRAGERFVGSVVRISLHGQRWLGGEIGDVLIQVEPLAVPGGTPPSWLQALRDTAEAHGASTNTGVARAAASVLQHLHLPPVEPGAVKDIEFACRQRGDAVDIERVGCTDADGCAVIRNVYVDRPMTLQVLGLPTAVAEGFVLALAAADAGAAFEPVLGQIRRWGFKYRLEAHEGQSTLRIYTDSGAPKPADNLEFTLGEPFSHRLVWEAAYGGGWCCEIGIPVAPARIAPFLSEPARIRPIASESL